MAYKVFSNGDALTGSELNTYLMNQSVMVFATATARDAALTTPSEGMVVWLQDSDKYVYYTGSAWADLITPASSGNAIINGAFDIWQRGAGSFNPSGAWVYTADRWRAIGNGSGFTRAVTRENFTPGAAPVAGYEAAYFLKYNQSVAGTGASVNHLEHQIEDVRTLAGQTVTLSFWAKASASTTLDNILFKQEFGSGGSSSVDTTFVTSPVIGTSWTRYSYTVAIPSISGKTIGTNSSTAVRFNMPISSTFNFDIWGVQLEAGSTATTFKRNGANIADELASCQRYYQRFNSINLYGLFGFGKAYNSNTLNLVFSLPVQMRGVPNLIETSAMSTIQYETGSTSGNTPTSITLNTFSSTNAIVGADLNKSGAFSTGAFYFIQAYNNASAYIAFGAEL